MELWLARSPMGQISKINHRELAAICGVSRATVSLALRNHPRISHKTKKLVQDKARELGYKAHPQVSALMTKIRLNRETASSGSVMAAYSNLNPDDFRTLDPYRLLWRGAEQQALSYGYKLELFSAKDYPVSPDRLTRILLARGITGLGFLYCKHPLRELPIQPEAFALAGISLRWPFPATDYDSFSIMSQCCRRIAERNYKRVGYVLHGLHVPTVDIQYKASFNYWLDQTADQERIPPFDLTGWPFDRFVTWLKKHKPDVIVCKDLTVLGWLRKLKLTPDKVGFVCPHLDENQHGVAGIYQPMGKLGAKLIDLVESRMRRNELGLEEQSIAVILQGEWLEGKTLPAMASSRKNLCRARSVI